MFYHKNIFWSPFGYSLIVCYQKVFRNKNIIQQFDLSRLIMSLFVSACRALIRFNITRSLQLDFFWPQTKFQFRSCSLAICFPCESNLKIKHDLSGVFFRVWLWSLKRELWYFWLGFQQKKLEIIPTSCNFGIFPFIFSRFVWKNTWKCPCFATGISSNNQDLVTNFW